MKSLCKGALALALIGCGAPRGRYLEPAQVAVSASAPARLEEQPAQFDTEAYDHIAENDFMAALDHPYSTFSIDVDTASYSNVRRFLTGGRLPPADAVRIEELINYFSYDYQQPAGEQPFAVHAELGECPWAPGHKLLHLGLQGRRIDAGALPPRNLVFLIDVSGSMESSNKLPLVKSSLELLVEHLSERDRVAIAVYAGASGLVLEPTSGADKARIRAAIGRLEAGGSTNGGEGIRLAYATARQSFIPGGINRVLLATDGDFNVGVTSQGELTRLIEEERESGVFISVLGYGMGNLKDSTMENLADRGNGNYAYIDSIAEARKVLVTEAGATLVAIAKDVKLQVEFNPAQVAAYRLIGYENRLLRDRDFNDDRKDAGEIGAGHNVTALYEIVPAGQKVDAPAVDDLEYQEARERPEPDSSRVPSASGAHPRLSRAAAGGELANVKIRFKQPEGSTSELLSFPIGSAAAAATSDDFRFSAAVAAFGMLLRGSAHKGAARWEDVIEWAAGARGADREGYRAELIALVERARQLAGPTAVKAAVAR